jgi:hypothetical protein
VQLLKQFKDQLAQRDLLDPKVPKGLRENRARRVRRVKRVRLALNLLAIRYVQAATRKYILFTPNPGIHGA